jgi:hypothetical protein
VRLVQFAHHLDVVAGHDLLIVGVGGALGPGQRARLIGCSDEHLWPVVVTEASVTAALLLAQHIHGDEELLVRLDLSGDGNDHTTPDIVSLHTTEKKARVIAGARLVARLLEGLDVGDFAPNGRGALADELDFAVLLQNTALDTSGDDGTTSSDREDVLDSHEKGLLDVAGGCGNPCVYGLEQLIDLLRANLGPALLERAERRAHDDGRVVALEPVAREQFAHLHLHKLQHLLVLNRIDLVDEHDDLLHTDLAGEQQVLTSLRHLTVRGGYDNDGAVHIGCSRNHVLDVIGVTGAVDVCVVASVSRVLDVGCRDGNTALALFGRLVNGAILEELCKALGGLSLGDGGSEGRLQSLVGVGGEARVLLYLSVINVTDGSYN